MASNSALGDVKAAIEALELTRWNGGGGAGMIEWSKPRDGQNHAEVARALAALRSAEAALALPVPAVEAGELAHLRDGIEMLRAMLRNGELRTGPGGPLHDWKLRDQEMRDQQRPPAPEEPKPITRERFVAWFESLGAEQRKEVWYECEAMTADEVRALVETRGAQIKVLSERIRTRDEERDALLGLESIARRYNETEEIHPVPAGFFRASLHKLDALRSKTPSPDAEKAGARKDPSGDVSAAFCAVAPGVEETGRLPGGESGGVVPTVKRDATCAWHDGHDGDPMMGIPAVEGEVCGAPATHKNCHPFVGAPTCAAHKCRCAKLLPIDPSPGVPDAGPDSTVEKPSEAGPDSRVAPDNPGAGDLCPRCKRPAHECEWWEANRNCTKPDPLDSAECSNLSWRAGVPAVAPARHLTRDEANNAMGEEIERHPIGAPAHDPSAGGREDPLVNARRCLNAAWSLGEPAGSEWRQLIETALDGALKMLEKGRQ